MKILFLSDLNWHAHLKTITQDEIAMFDLSDLSKSRYERLARYYNVVKNVKPDLVLLAGDITGDGSCGHGFQNAMKLFLLLLESQKIQTMFISGNHDPIYNYDSLSSFASQLKHCQEISNKLISFNGINIFGLSFRSTASKSALKKIYKAVSGKKVDICLAHSELKRRIRLFDTNAQLIVTGHYDRKLCKIENSYFVSLDNDWEEYSYATADFSEKILSQLDINIQTDKTTRLTYKVKIGESINHHVYVNEQAALNLDNIETYPVDSLKTENGTSLAYLKYLRGQNYIKLIESMRQINREPNKMTDQVIVDQLFKSEITPTYKVSKHLIKDYLPNAFS